MEAVIEGKDLDRLHSDPATGEVYAREQDIPFYQDQVRIALHNCGAIDPEDIRAYLGKKGYQGLARALTMEKQAVIEELDQANLRGRGGGGFPAARKWAIAAAQGSTDKFIICNGDEGDPGAFMDRSIMEGDPHSVLEGMAIAGYAIGASQGFIYVRAEYPLAVKRLQKAVQEAKEWRLLGDDILGSGFSFDIAIKQGAGAFVCGEETALIASIEGMRGMPAKPLSPRWRACGASLRLSIMWRLWLTSPHFAQGAKWFRKVGTADSPGTDLALTGCGQYGVG